MARCRSSRGPRGLGDRGRALAGLLWGLWATWTWGSGLRLTLPEIGALAALAGGLAALGALSWATFGGAVAALPKPLAWAALAMALALFVAQGTAAPGALLGLTAAVLGLFAFVLRRSDGTPLPYDTVNMRRIWWFLLLPGTALAAYGAADFAAGANQFAIDAEFLTFLALSMGTALFTAALMRGFMAR